MWSNRAPKWDMTDEKKWGHVRVPPDIFKDLRDTAEQEDRTLAAVLRRAWEFYKAKKEGRSASTPPSE